MILLKVKWDEWHGLTCLEREFSGTLVKEIFKGRAHEVHHHHVMAVLSAEVIDLCLVRATEVESYEGKEGGLETKGGGREEGSQGNLEKRKDGRKEGRMDGRKEGKEEGRKGESKEGRNKRWDIHRGDVSRVLDPLQKRWRSKGCTRWMSFRTIQATHTKSDQIKPDKIECPLRRKDVLDPLSMSASTM